MTIVIMPNMTRNFRVPISQALLTAITNMIQDIATATMSMTADMMTDMTTMNMVVDERHHKKVETDPKVQ